MGKSGPDKTGEDTGKAILFGACVASFIIYFSASHGIRGYIGFLQKILTVLTGS